MEQNKGAQRAAWFAGQAVSAATNPKLFIVKVLVTILAGILTPYYGVSIKCIT